MRRGLLALALFVLGCARSAEPPTLTVSAAASLAAVMPALSQAFQDESGVRVAVNLGATGTLAHQIRGGAPVDVLLAADLDTLDGLAQGGFVVPESRVRYARGRLVAWYRARLGEPLPSALADLTRVEVRRVALANPALAPYGAAASDALARAGLYDALEPRIVWLDNVRQAQQVVAAGNADVAIVPLSLVLRAGGAWFPLPEGLGVSLEQSAGLVQQAPNPDGARRFLAFLVGERARTILEQAGFALPARGAPPVGP